MYVYMYTILSYFSSHWEKRILNHALMNGYISRYEFNQQTVCKSLCLISSYSDYLVLSQFTIALLEDSGWYKGNYTALEMLNQFPLQWGKGRYLGICWKINLKTCVCLNKQDWGVLF